MRLKKIIHRFLTLVNVEIKIKQIVVVPLRKFYNFREKKVEGA